MATFDGVVKETFGELKTDSCQLVPLPSTRIVPKASSIVSPYLDAAKVKKFEETWGGTIGALSKTESSICLPSVQSLNKLSLAQAEVGRSFGVEESKRFASKATPTLRGAVSLNSVLPLLSDAKLLAPAATAAEKAEFQKAGKVIERAQKQESIRIFNEELKVKAQAKKAEAAAKAGGGGSGWGVPATQTTQQAEVARQAKQEEFKAKQAARLEAQAARKAEALAASSPEAIRAKQAALVAAQKEKAEAQKAAAAEAAAKAREFSATAAVKREAAGMP